MPEKYLNETSTKQVLTNINKNRYNLGAFDSKSGNTITRQTGYCFGSEYAGVGTTESGRAVYIYSSKKTNRVYTDIKNNLSYELKDSEDWWRTSANLDSAKGYISFSSGPGELVVIPPVGTIPDDKLVIQYKLPSAYTETIINNQPIHTLDQSGEEWVRDEWDKQLNLFDINKSTNGYFVDSTTGNLVSGINLSVSDYIGIKPNTNYANNITVQPSWEEAGLAFYDSSKNYISGIRQAVNELNNFISPNNAKYVRITVLDSEKNNVMLNKGDHSYPYQPYHQSAHITDEEAELLKSEWEKQVNLINAASSKANYYVDHATGNETYYGSDSVTVTDFIEVEEGQTYYFSGYTSNNSGNSACLYDNDKTYISGSGDTYVAYTSLSPITIPSGAKYIRLNLWNLHFSNGIQRAVFNKGDHAYPYQPYNGPILHEKDIENAARIDKHNQFIFGQTITESADSTILYLSTTYSNSPNIEFAGSGGRKGSIGFDNTTPAVWEGNGTKHPIAVTNANNYFTSQQNLGSSTTNTILTLNTTANTSPNILFTANGTSKGYIGFDNTTPTVWEANGTNHPIAVTNSNNYFSIKQAISDASDNTLLSLSAGAHDSPNIKFTGNSVDRGYVGFSGDRPYIWCVNHTVKNDGEIMLDSDYSYMNEIEVFNALNDSYDPTNYDYISVSDTEMGSIKNVPVGALPVVSIDGFKGNSLVVNNHTASFQGTVRDNILTASYDSSTGVLTLTRTANAYVDVYCGKGINNVTIKNGHAYLTLMEVKVTTSVTGTTFSMNPYPSYFSMGSQNLTVGEWNMVMLSATATQDYSDTMEYYTRLYGLDALAEGDTVQYRNVRFIDLTQFFGSNSLIPDDLIADPSLFTKKYWKGSLAYNAGTLVNSQPEKIVSHGFNLWDEEWEVGWIDTTSGLNAAASDALRSKNYIRVKAGAQYYYKGGSARFYFYDANDNFIFTDAGYTNSTFTVPANAVKMRFALSNLPTPVTYNNDICINISSSLNGRYKPYRAPLEYPLVMPIMRSAGTIRDDVEKAKVGSYTFTGSESWTWDAGTEGGLWYTIVTFSSNQPKSGAQYLLSNGYNVSIILISGNNYVLRVSYGNNGGRITSETNMNALFPNGTTINYELATPTEQSNITYPETIKVEEGGYIEQIYSGNYAEMDVTYLVIDD